MTEHDAALLREADDHAAAEIFDIARDILAKEGLTDFNPYLDLVFHALTKGVAIGLMDSVTANKVMRFADTHERLFGSQV